MDLGLNGQSVLVTGSSSGIGRAAAIAFGAEGARVAVTYQANREGAEETARRVQAAGGQALVARYDLGEPESIRACLAVIQQTWGTLQVLVNNAVAKQAGPSGQLFEEVPLAEWQAMLRSSLEGVALTVQCALPMMRAGGWGRIVMVSSDAVDGWPGLGPYATAKAGLHGLSRTLAAELGPADILSNVVMPGFVLTEKNQQRVPPQHQEQVKQFTPTRRLTTNEDIASAIVFLGSRTNRQITGEVLRITGGRH
jgi:NAD(P)-dependent dehydrogenase (short-subunit alcohol dehydrogenase family)